MGMIKTVKGNVNYVEIVRRRNIKDMMRKKKWDVKNAKKKTKLSLETLLGSVRFVKPNRNRLKMIHHMNTIEQDKCSYSCRVLLLWHSLYLCLFFPQ